MQIIYIIVRKKICRILHVTLELQNLWLKNEFIKCTYLRLY